MPIPEKDKPVIPEKETEELAVVSKPAGQKEQPAPLKRALGIFLRIVLFLAFLVVLAAGAYYGFPILYDRYVRPVEMNASQVVDLTQQQSRNGTQIAALKMRLATLEAVGTSQANSLNEQSTRIEALEKRIATHTAALSALEETQAGLQAVDEESRAELERQIGLLKSMELLSRARLFLYQSNFGLARQDVQVARDLLAEIQPGAPEPLDAEIPETLLRLDLVLQNLPSFPVAASDDLDIAWQILLQGIPLQGLETSTPAPAAVPEVLSTPTSGSDSTSTPTP